MQGRVSTGLTVQMVQSASAFRLGALSLGGFEGRSTGTLDSSPSGSI